MRRLSVPKSYSFGKKGDKSVSLRLADAWPSNTICQVWLQVPGGHRRLVEGGRGWQVKSLLIYPFWAGVLLVSWIRVTKESCWKVVWLVHIFTMQFWLTFALFFFALFTFLCSSLLNLFWSHTLWKCYRVTAQNYSDPGVHSTKAKHCYILAFLVEFARMYILSSTLDAF